MPWIRFRTPTLLAVCFICMISQATVLLAQNQNKPVWYQRSVLSGGVMEYRDQELGTSFRAGSDWELAPNGVRWQDYGWKKSKASVLATTVTLTHAPSHAVLTLYYRSLRQPGQMTPREIDSALAANVDDKISQRREQGELQDYRVRARSYQQNEVSGWRALSYVADFTQGDNKMSEYLVWIQSDRTLAEFFVRSPASDIDEIMHQVDPIVKSLRIP